MIEFIINYILTGVLFIFIVDVSTEYARRKGIQVPNESEWNWSSRAFAVLVWPIGIYYFTTGFLNVYFNNKNKKK